MPLGMANYKGGRAKSAEHEKCMHTTTTTPNHSQSVGSAKSTTSNSTERSDFTRWRWQLFTPWGRRVLAAALCNTRCCTFLFVWVGNSEQTRWTFHLGCDKTRSQVGGKASW